MHEFLIGPPQQYSSWEERNYENMMLRDSFIEAKNKLIYVTKKSIEEENGNSSQRSTNDVIRNKQQKHERFQIANSQKLSKLVQGFFRECVVMVMV